MRPIPGTREGKLLLNPSDAIEDTSTAGMMRRPPPRSRSSDADDRVCKLIRLSDVEPTEIDWLWPGRIAVGLINLIVGDAGLGKSTVTLDIAARVTTGRPWPDAPDTSADLGSVILLSDEDDLSSVTRPRLDKARANTDRIHAVSMKRRSDDSEVQLNLKSDLARLEEAIHEVDNVRMVVIDPISAYMSGTDDRDNIEVRALLTPLAKMAKRLRFAGVVVHHLRKNPGVSALGRVHGSVGFGATARSAWTIHQDPQRPERRLMLLTKNNYHAGQGGLAFSIVDGAICWESAPVHMTSDQAHAAQEDARRAKKPSDRAVEFLRGLLGPGRMLATEVFKRGAERGLSKRTLRNALDRAGCTAKREGFGGHIYWSLVPVIPDDPEVHHLEPTGTSGTNGSNDTVDDFEEEQG